ncbi:hypothetical protein PtB15_2B680 [Puccinia triticina]|nr:hypothetical protein PtB15_2B680 [Puccinia triticina]
MSHSGENELESFRNEWIQEVSRAGHGPTPLEADSSTRPAAQPPVPQSALIIYARAVYYERTGLLDDALVHYRKALRLEPNIDRAYHDLKAEEIDSLERRWITSTSSENHPDPPFSFSRSVLAEQDAHTPYPSTDHDRPDGGQPRRGHKVDRIQGLQEGSAADAQHRSSTTRLLNYLISSFENNPWHRQPPGEQDDDHPGPELATRPEEREDGSVSQIDEQLSALTIEACVDGPEEEGQPKPPAGTGLVFEPEDVERGCAIERLPAELFTEHILSGRGYRRATIHLLVGAVETFARVCRRARLLTLGPSVWRTICLAIYTHDLFVNRRPPVLPVDRPKLVEALCRKAHAHDWRRMFIEQTRLRLDGCYISLVRYPRLGESANPWYTPTHFVTYFRYLRFLEDGRCMSYTSTDEPGQVVRSLDWPMIGGSSTSSGMQTSGGAGPAGGKSLEGMLFGLWTLEEDRVKLFKLHQDPRRLLGSSVRRGPPFTDRPAGRAAYEFEIEAKLLSSRRGKMSGPLSLSPEKEKHKGAGRMKLICLVAPYSDSSFAENSPSSSSSKPFIFSRVVAYDPS